MCRWVGVQDSVTRSGRWIEAGVDDGSGVAVRVGVADDVDVGLDVGGTGVAVRVGVVVGECVVDGGGDAVTVGVRVGSRALPVRISFWKLS
jgi:hypothetical protein